MKLIRNKPRENEGALISQLEEVGFTVDQAKRFLPEATTSFLDSIQDKDIEQITALIESDSPAQLLNAVSIDSFSDNLNIDSDLATKGLTAIAPIYAQLFSKIRMVWLER